MKRHRKSSKNERSSIAEVLIAVHREKISETIPVKVQLSVKNCLKRLAGKRGVSAWVREVIIEKLSRLVEGEQE